MKLDYELQYLPESCSETGKVTYFSLKVTCAILKFNFFNSLGSARRKCIVVGIWQRYLCLLFDSNLGFDF